MWRYYLPIEATLAFSAVYEMMEAGMASILSPKRLEEFVGMQGDIWDSQEDMLMAGLGSVVAMICVYQFGSGGRGPRPCASWNSRITRLPAKK